MKQLKFLMVAFTLLMGVSLTSCIGESDPTVTGVTFGEIVGSFPTVIKAPDGIKFTAVNALDGLDFYSGDYVYFQYSYNSDEQDLNTKNINATITIGEKLTYRPSVIAPDKGEKFENVTVLQIGNGPDSNVKFVYYDKSKLIVPVFFLAKEEIKGHDFTLVYDQENVTATDTEIVFYLRQMSTETEVKKATLSYKLFDISGALELFTATTSNKPTKVTIYANETKDNTSDALDKKKEELTKYSVEYSFKDE